LPNEICFIMSAIYHPHAGENSSGPGARRNFASSGRSRESYSCKAMPESNHAFVAEK
jgi:hypothetical protein